MKKHLGISAWILMLAAAIACTNISRDVLSDGRSVFSGGREEIARVETLEGTVLDSQTGKGIPGATVELKNANLGVGYFKTVTDSRGRYRIDGFIKNISYNVTVLAGDT